MASLDLSAFEGMTFSEVLKCTYDVLECVCPLCLAGQAKELTVSNFAQHVGASKHVASSKKPQRHKLGEGGSPIPLQALAVLAIFVHDLDSVKNQDYAAYSYVGAAVFLCELMKARELLPVRGAREIPGAQMPRNLPELARKELRALQVSQQEQRKALELEEPDLFADDADNSPDIISAYMGVSKLCCDERRSSALRAAFLADQQRPPEQLWIPTTWEKLCPLFALALELEGEQLEPGQGSQGSQGSSIASLLDEDALSDDCFEDESEGEDEGEDEGKSADAAPGAAAGDAAGDAAGAESSMAAAKRQRLVEHFATMEADKPMQRIENELHDELEDKAPAGFRNFLQRHLPKPQPSPEELNNNDG